MHLPHYRVRLLTISVSAIALASLATGLKAEEAKPPVAQPVVEAPATPAPTTEVSEAARSEAPKTDAVETATPASPATPVERTAEPAAPEPVQRAEPAPAQQAEPSPAPVQQAAEPAAPPAAPAVAVAPEAPQPSPVVTALREIFAAIEAQPMPRDAQGRAVREDMKAIAAFYAARDFAPVWRDGETWAPSAASAISRLQKAGEDALDPSAWKAPALSAGDAPSVAAADVALSHSVVAYGRQASGGRVNPMVVSRLITAKPEIASATAILEKVSTAGGNAGDVLHGFNPPHPGYRALRAKLAEIRGAKPEPKETPVAIGPGPVLRVGMSDQRVPLIRARFGLTPNEPNIDPLVYDTKVAGAIAEFQRSKGLRATGQLTLQTVLATTPCGLLIICRVRS